MEQLDQITQTISLTMGAAWASGINLYATILVLGVLGLSKMMTLPEGLHILMNPLVLGAAGLMYFIEFFADKIPGIDNAWDSIHTFIRIPAGVLLAAGAIGEVNTPLVLAAALIGGGISAGSHAAKAGTRVLINASPEPFTNWGASFGEDVAVVAGLWTAMNYPWVFLGFLAIFFVLLIWLLPKIWRGIKKMFGTLAGLFGKEQPEPQHNPPL